MPLRPDPGVTSPAFYPHGISAAIFRGALEMNGESYRLAQSRARKANNTA